MTSRRRVHGFHACVHVCVQEVSEWPRTMDNKTFNSLFYRLPRQMSRAGNDHNYFVSESVQMCACVEKTGNKTQRNSRQQQMWDIKSKIYIYILVSLHWSAWRLLTYLNCIKAKYEKKLLPAALNATIWGVVTKAALGRIPSKLESESPQVIVTSERKEQRKLHLLVMKHRSNSL